MLVLTRKIADSEDLFEEDNVIYIEGSDGPIKIYLFGKSGEGQVRVGIKAARNVKISRGSNAVKRVLKSLKDIS